MGTDHEEYTRYDQRRQIFWIKNVNKTDDDTIQVHHLVSYDIWPPLDAGWEEDKKWAEDRKPETIPGKQHKKQEARDQAEKNIEIPWKGKRVFFIKNKIGPEVRTQ